VPRAAYWIIGVLIALAGVCIARLVAPALPADYQTWTSALGITIAVVGVLASALGAGRK